MLRLGFSLAEAGMSIRRSVGPWIIRQIGSLQRAFDKSQAPLQVKPKMSEKETSPASSAAISDNDDGKSLNVLPIELPVLCQFPEDLEEEYPEGGRGWLVVAGCFLQAAVTLGTNT